MTAHCWQLLPSDCHRSVAVPSARPQLTASSTLPALTFVSVHLFAPTLVNFHCWHVLPSACQTSSAVPLAVPQLTASSTLPLARLVSRYVEPLTGNVTLLAYPTETTFD